MKMTPALEQKITKALKEDDNFIERQLQALENSAIVFEVNFGGDIINQNALFGKFFSYGRQRFCPGNLKELYEKFHLHIPLEILRKLEPGENYKATLHFQGANSSIYALNLNVTSFFDEYTLLPVSYLCIATVVNNIPAPIKDSEISFYCDHLSQCKHINRLERITESIGVEFLAKARELKESVVYAERIQRAIVPSKNQIIEYLPNNFEVELLYEPKDTISGDFYWAGEGKTGFHFMIGDSTGHGVPSALLSMLGISSVTKLIEERQIEDPARILTCLDNFWYEKLYKTVEKNNRIEDTIEASLCKIKEGSNIVELASAMLPIYVVSSKDIKQAAGAKRPIGGSLYGRETPYKTHKLALEPGDTVYLFSDGFFSQLGGSHNRYKPIGKKRFRQWLQEAQSIENLTDRISELLARYKHWQGDNEEQTDDIVLFALRYVG